jgi:hypothetical protein
VDESLRDLKCQSLKNCEMVSKRTISLENLSSASSSELYLGCRFHSPLGVKVSWSKFW